jgi:tetratricopeptide (TPR) repeat protein
LHPRPWPKSLLCDAAALDAFEHTQAGRTDQATEIWLAAVDVASREGDQSNAARAALELARLERSRRHPQTALTWLDNARSQAELASDAALLAVISLELGHVQSARQRWPLARRAWSEARQRAREIDRHDIAFAALLQLWRLARAQADAADERAALRALRLLSRSIEEIPRDASDVLPHLRRTQPASERSNVNG